MADQPETLTQLGQKADLPASPDEAVLETVAVFECVTLLEAMTFLEDKAFLLEAMTVLEAMAEVEALVSLMAGQNDVDLLGLIKGHDGRACGRLSRAECSIDAEKNA